MNQTLEYLPIIAAPTIPFASEGYSWVQFSLVGSGEISLEGAVGSGVATYKPSDTDFASVRSYYKEGIYAVNSLPTLLRFRLISGSYTIRVVCHQDAIPNNVNAEELLRAIESVNAISGVNLVSITQLNSAIQQALIATASNAKFISVTTDNPPNPTAVDLVMYPGAIRGYKQTASGAIQGIQWNRVTLTWDNVGQPSATLADTRAYKKDLAAQGLLSEFQSFTISMPRLPIVQELNDYGAIVGFRTLVSGAQQPVTWNRALSQWDDTGSPRAFQASVDVVKSAIGNLLLANLATKTQANGPQFVDGNRWTWSATGAANGGTVVAGVTGFWKREYSGFADVRWWGVLPDSISVRDNGPEIQAAVNALGSGGVLTFPAGLTFSMYSKVIVPFQFSFIGAGEDTSLIRFMDQSGEWFQVRSIGSALFMGIGFKPPSDTAALLSGSVISLRGDSVSTMNAGTRIRSCSFLSHYVGVDIIAAFGYVISDSKFNNLQDNGVSIKIANSVNPDYGDGVIERNVFHAKSTAVNTRAIQQLAGGGMRIKNNKFYLHTYAYNMYLLDGAGTGILFIQDNSFESQGNHALLFERQSDAAANYYAKIIISGNQFNEDGISSIKIAGGAVLKMFDIKTNQFTIKADGTAIDLVSGIIAVVDLNTFIRDGTLSGTAIQLGNAFVLPTIGEQNVYRNIAYRLAGSVQPVLNATNFGQTANLKSAVTITQGILTTGEYSIQGGGTDNALSAAITLPVTTDLMTIQPPADGNAREGATYRDLALFADAGGRDALHIDLTGNRKMSRVTFDNLYLRSSNRYAMFVDNEMSGVNGFAVSRFLGGTYNGGLNLQGIGDSINIIGGVFTGGNEAIRIRQITNLSAAAGDSSQVLILGINTSANKGIFIERATRIRIQSSNLECGAGPGSLTALIALQGGPGEVITGSIRDCLIAAAPFAKYGVFLGTTKGVMIDGCTIAAPGGIAGSACIFISADSSNTIVGSNTYEGTDIIDNGVGSMGVLKLLTGFGAGVTAASGRPVPSFVKTPSHLGGTVQLSGSVAGPNTANTVLGLLPVGFRPTGNVFATVFAQDSGFVRGSAIVYIDTGGYVSLVQVVAGLGAALTDVNLGSLSFYSPRV